MTDSEWREMLADAFDRGRTDGLRHRVVLAHMGGPKWDLFWEHCFWVPHCESPHIRAEYERGWNHGG